jgi:hypothetical protein
MLSNSKVTQYLSRIILSYTLLGPGPQSTACQNIEACVDCSREFGEYRAIIKLLLSELNDRIRSTI